MTTTMRQHYRNFIRSFLESDDYSFTEDVLGFTVDCTGKSQLTYLTGIIFELTEDWEDEKADIKISIDYKEQTIKFIL